MPKVLTIVLVILGVVLLCYGLNALNSVSSSITEAVNGTPADGSIWLVAFGAIGIATGLFFRKTP